MDVILALKKEQEEGVVDIDSREDEEAEKVLKPTKRKKKASDPHYRKKRACVDCTKRCVRIHGRVCSSSGNTARTVSAVPSFFKVMVGYFSDSMEIPPPFAKTVLDLAGSNIYLEDSFGLRWRVRLCLRDGVLSFGHGWNNFVLDHAVSCGEFLVFRQIARTVFTVQVFAPSAVERLYLCEKNKRQSRKRKPRWKPSVPTVKMSKNDGESSKKKRPTDHQNDQVPSDCNKQVQVCIDDAPDSAWELKYSETSEKAPEAESQEIFRRQEIAENCTTFAEGPICDPTEIELVDGSSLPANVDASEPLAMIDLNEVGIDDIYLSADIYEFESGLYNPEAFSGDLNKGRLITDGETSGFNCPEHDMEHQHSSMGVGQSLVVSQGLPYIENKQMVDALEACNTDANVPEHDTDRNVSPAKEPLSLGVGNSSPPIDAEVKSSECALCSCDKDKCSCNGNQAAKDEDSCGTQDKPQGGQVNLQCSTEQHTAEIMSTNSKQDELPHVMKEIVQRADHNSGDLQTGSAESGGALARAAKKFCIAVPPPSQTWLELPGRLPVIPRTKKQGGKVVILKDPCNRLWPALYQCTPRFSGFITGWVDISRENSLREGDTCEFELGGNSELSFRVRSSHCCPAT